MSGLPLIAPDWDAPANVVARVSTRAGGVSGGAKGTLNLAARVGDDAAAVRANRDLFAREFDAAKQWQWLHQVHGPEAVRVQEAGGEITADGLITGVPGVACCILTADCLPVFLCDDSGTEIAVAHCGWRGLATGVLARTLAGMHCDPARVMAWMGPAIGPCHFEVGNDVRNAFLDVSEEFSAFFHPARTDGKYLADLYGICRRQLRSLGVIRVSGGGYCTYCDESRFFSHRRDPHGGRMASAICLR